MVVLLFLSKTCDRSYKTDYIASNDFTLTRLITLAATAR